MLTKAGRSENRRLKEGFSQLFLSAHLKHAATPCQRDVWSSQLPCLGGSDSAFYSFPKLKRGEKEKKNTSIFVREVYITKVCVLVIFKVCRTTHTKSLNPYLELAIS